MTSNKALHLTGAAVSVLESSSLTEAAPAGELGVRHEFHRSGKEVRQQQQSLAK